MTAWCLRAGEQVLKVAFERTGEAAALRAFGGRAAVALVAEDAARNALLLERVDPGTALPQGRTDVVAALFGELWDAPNDGQLPLLAEMAERWLPRLSGEPAALLRDLLADPGPQRVLHGDLHPANVLAATRRPWLAIDPKGLVGDPAYDCAMPLRDGVTEANAARRLAVLSEATGCDPARIRAWAVVHCAESADECAGFGEAAAAARFAEAGRVIAALPG